MKCEDSGPLLLDENASRSGDVEAHLSSCARCQTLVRAHQSALKLRGLRLDLPARTSPAPRGSEVPVRSLWRKRLLLRASFIGLVAGLAVVALVTGPNPPAPLPPAPTPSVARRGVQPADASDDLRKLILEVDSYTQKDATAADPALEPFGGLPDLLTPEAERR